MEENKKNKIPNVPNLRFKHFTGEYSIKHFYDIVSITNGQVDPNNQKYRTLPHIGPGNIEKETGFLLPYNLAFQDHLISSKYLFDESCVIYGKINPHFAKAAYPGFVGLCSADAYPLRPSQEVIPYYLLEMVLSKRFTKFTSSISKRTGMPKVNREDLKPYVFYIPSIQEQEKVVGLVQKIDERIKTQNKIIEKYESLIKQLNDDIFSRGDNSKISDFIQELSKRNKDGVVTNVLSVSNKNGFVKQSEQFEDKELASEDKTNYKIVQKGDFAFNPARINVGSIALLKKQEIGIVSPMYICFKAKNIPSEILESYFSSSSFKKEMNKRLEGSVRMCLTIDGMKNIRFHNPSKKEINILSRLTKLKELVVISKRILDLYNSQKSYLLSNLFI